jgi:excisionase family DNA binding protein
MIATPCFYRGETLQLLTVKQACDYFQVSRNVLKAMINDGRVEAIDIRKPGGAYAKWRIKKISLTNVADLKLLDFIRRAGL